MYKTLIEEAAAAWQLDLPADRLSGYLVALFEKNKVMNLTAITEPSEMVLRHIMDSLALMKLGLVEAGKLIDIGTGGGTPGIPLALCLPNLFVTLNDPLNKRCDFLREVTADIKNTSVLQGRAEDLAKAPVRESFDFATARAVANLRTLSEYCLPYVKMGGLFVPMKSGDVEVELQEAKNAIGTMGGKIEDIKYYEIPKEGVWRAVIVIRKVRNTDAKYPRNAGRIKKNPL